MSTTINRRALVAGAASTAVASPTIATALPTADPPGSPDAELVALGEQFVALMKRWLLLNAEQRVRGWEAHAKAWKLAGVDDPDKHTPEDVERLFEHWGSASDENGFTKFHREAEETRYRCSPSRDA